MTYLQVQLIVCILSCMIFLCGCFAAKASSKNVNSEEVSSYSSSKEISEDVKLDKEAQENFALLQKSKILTKPPADWSEHARKGAELSYDVRLVIDYCDKHEAGSIAASDAWMGYFTARQAMNKAKKDV